MILFGVEWGRGVCRFVLLKRHTNLDGKCTWWYYSGLWMMLFRVGVFRYYSYVCVILVMSMYDIIHVYVWYYIFQGWGWYCSRVYVGLYSDVIAILFHDKCNIIPFSIWYYSMINVIIITHYCDTSREPVWDHSVYNMILFCNDHDIIICYLWYYSSSILIIFRLQSDIDPV